MLVVVAVVAIVVVVVVVVVVGAQETLLRLKEGIPTEVELAADAADVLKFVENNGAAAVPDGAREKDVVGCLAAGKVNDNVVAVEEANGVEATAEPVPKLIEGWEGAEEVPGMNESIGGAVVVVEVGVEVKMAEEEEAGFKKEDNPVDAPNGDEAGEVVVALELEEEKKLGNETAGVALGAENEPPLKSPLPVVEAVEVEVVALDDNPKKEEPEVDDDKLVPNNGDVEPVDWTPNGEGAVTAGDEDGAAEAPNSDTAAEEGVVPKRGEGDSAGAGAPKRGEGDAVGAGAPKRGEGDAVGAGAPKRGEGDAAEAEAPKRGEGDAAEAEAPKRGEEDAVEAGAPKRGETEAAREENRGEEAEGAKVEDEEEGKGKEKGEGDDEGAVDPNVEGDVPEEKGEAEENPDMTAAGGGGVRAGFRAFLL